MKIRSGFVSNSSSSSFIVIGQLKNDEYINKLKKDYGNRDTLAIKANWGVHEFGWEEIKYSQFWDRVMFTFIQADYRRKDKPQWTRMLNNTLKEKLNVKHIIWGITTQWQNRPKETESAYIDHQSSSEEGTNTEMFESKENLENFLFSGGSYIQGGNNNS